MTRSMRVAQILGGIVFACLSGAVWAQVVDFKQVAEFKKGVVRIEATVRDSEGVRRPSVGTGFIFRLENTRTYIITASHVVEGDSAPRVSFFTQRQPLRTAQILGLEGDDPLGLALLRVEGELPQGLLALNVDPGKEFQGAEDLIAIGQPLSAAPWSVFKGNFSSRQGKQIFFSPGIEGGYSGGPLLFEDKVVGVVMQTTQTTRAISAVTLMEFLRERLDPVRPQTVPTPRKPGQIFTECSDCPEMVVVRAGSFPMGSPAIEQGHNEDEGPVHPVTISHPFAVGKFEITRGQFARFVTATGHKTGGGCFQWDDKSAKWTINLGASWSSPGFAQSDDHPVVCVSWEDAKAYAAWLAKVKTGKPYRLLSEAEWEYAARAGSDKERFWEGGTDPACRFANVHDETGKAKHKFNRTEFLCNDGYAWTAGAGSFKPNAFGLYHTLGNVWEWVEDCWNGSYDGAPADGRVWATGDCSRRVSRGGSWYSFPAFVRSADRYGFDPSVRINDLGFRVARTLP